MELVFCNRISHLHFTDGLALASVKFQITEGMSAIAITTFIAQHASVPTLTR
ncbi:hypothetical protein [Nostoc sp.]|uniref:hypothetical protein n=1 Tax=Nostoc sp. TaxID=1180 RepID=UPI002FFD0305